MTAPPTPSAFAAPLRRRTLLRAGACAALGLPAARSVRAGPPSPVAVAQIVDVSQAQQDVSKDFLIGSRAAWQDFNARGGLAGRPVRHLVLETDGRPESAARAVRDALQQTDCVALAGTVGDAAASQVTALLQRQGAGIGHAAPWLQGAGAAADSQTFPIFATRREQIQHALKSLALMNIREIGAVFGSPRERQLYIAELGRLGTELGLKISHYGGSGNLDALGQQLNAATPAMLLFLGGTPELVQFTQGLEKQARQRYLVGLADVNLQTMVQMGAARHTPVIATQAVPMVNAGSPVVRSYREAMARYFDEPATPHSLAGFLAARYVQAVLPGAGREPSRASVLAELRRRNDLDLGGFRISFNGGLPGSTFVTQSMLTVDGRVIG